MLSNKDKYEWRQNMWRIYPTRISSFFDHTSWFDDQTDSTWVELRKVLKTFHIDQLEKTCVKQENSIGYVSLCTCLIGIDDGQIRSSIIKSNVNRNSSMNTMKNWLGRASTSKSMLVTTTQRIMYLPFSLSRLFSLIFLWPWRVWVNEEKKQDFSGWTNLFFVVYWAKNQCMFDYLIEITKTKLVEDFRWNRVMLINADFLPFSLV